VELYARVRRAVVVEKMSEREAARQFGLARETVRKMLRYAVPPGYRRQQPVRRPRPKMSSGFLRLTPKVRFHFTPTYSSWLNQVELWFAKIQRDVIARGVFTSVADLGNKLRKYIRAYSQSAKPFRWTYTDPKRRITPNKIAGRGRDDHRWSPPAQIRTCAADAYGSYLGCMASKRTLG
jgi:hypothetical protein